MMKRLFASLAGGAALALAGMACHSAQGQTPAPGAPPASAPAKSQRAQGQASAPPKAPAEMVQISRAELEQLRRACRGGPAGQAASRGTGGSGAAGKATPRASAVPIAAVTFEGRVVRASPRRIDIRDQDGSLYNLRIDDQTRALQNGKPVSLQALQEGAPVRASFAFIGVGDERARTVELLQPGRRTGTPRRNPGASTPTPSQPAPGRRVKPHPGTLHR